MAIFANYMPVVVQALQARGLTGQCPMCQQNQWTLHDVPVSMPVYEATGSVKFPGTSMPMAAMICRNCGFAGFFTLGSLGLINAPPAEPAASTLAPQISDTPPTATVDSAPPEPVAQPSIETSIPEAKPRRRKRAPKGEKPSE